MESPNLKKSPTQHSKKKTRIELKGGVYIIINEITQKKIIIIIIYGRYIFILNANEKRACLLL
jgi:hypothetical protein